MEKARNPWEVKTVYMWKDRTIKFSDVYKSYLIILIVVVDQNVQNKNSLFQSLDFIIHFFLAKNSFSKRHNFIMSTKYKFIIHP